MYEGGLSVDLPMIPGHESAGEVVEVGDDVSRVDVGDRVAINPSVPCNACRQCKAGNENRCVELTSIGGAAGSTSSTARSPSTSPSRPVTSN